MLIKFRDQTEIVGIFRNQSGSFVDIFGNRWDLQGSVGLFEFVLFVAKRMDCGALKSNLISMNQNRKKNFMRYILSIYSENRNGCDVILPWAQVFDFYAEFKRKGLIFEFVSISERKRKRKWKKHKNQRKFA